MYKKVINNFWLAKNLLFLRADIFILQKILVKTIFPDFSWAKQILSAYCFGTIWKFEIHISTKMNKL